VLIRPARREDAAALASIHVRSWRETYPGLLPASVIDAATPEVRLAEWTRRLAAIRPRSGLWLAELEGAPVGFAGAGPARDPAALGTPGELYSLYLLRAAQGRGLGAALLRRAAAHLAALGLPAMGCWVAEENLRAIGFYAAMGGIPGPRRIEHRPEGDFPEIAYIWSGLPGVEPGPPVPPGGAAL
jgi:ribosomal protein S18 acetylase RimI-like enzyme